MSGKKIRILKNGPYLVSGGAPLKDAVIRADRHGVSECWEEGRDYAAPENYSLCRCGRSKKRPFCDGAHAACGFSGAETASREPYIDQAVLYEGEDLNLLDNENLCASLRFCDRGKRVWQLAEKSGDPKNKALAIEEACNCSAGRLTAVEKDGSVIEPALPREISPVKDPAADCLGPLWVKGGIPIESADGSTYEIRNRVTLCRCGESQNMPFCDTRHRNCPHMQGLTE